MQHVLAVAARPVAWMWDSILAGISRVGLEGISAWSRARLLADRARRLPDRLLAPFRRADARRRPVEADLPAAAGAASSHRALHLALDFALVGASLYVVLLMHRKIYGEMQAAPAYRVRLEEFQWTHRPAWATQDVTIYLPVDDALGRSARGCKPELVAEVGRRLERNPWIRSVTEVRRIYPNRLEARVEIRRPIAYVLRGTRGLFVDRDGVRLPDIHVGAQLPLGCYEVVGVDGAVPAVGSAWRHPGVRAALDVVAALNTYRVDRALALCRIDVTNIGGRRDPRASEILCWTPQGVPVAWGRPSGTTQFGENPVDVKMRHLALALEAFPGLQNLDGVDLRFDRVVVRPRPEFQVIAAGTPPPAAAPSRRP
jgi:hypothetical protein